MKFECEVVRFDVTDIVTTSGCAQPEVPVAVGGDLVPGLCQGQLPT